jgi:hypothetical protein
MSTPYRWTTIDEKMLDVKVAAYRAVTLSGTVFTKDGGESLRDLENLKNFIHSLVALASSSEESPEVFMKWVKQGITDAICRYCQDHPHASIAIQAFDSQTNDYPGLRLELQAWLERLRSFVASGPYKYVGWQPDVDLELAIDTRLKEPMGATTASDEARKMTISVNPKSFSEEHYYFLPYILSHEFWCHALSSHQSDQRLPATGQWKGCSQNDSWEEGWMDYVQAEMLEHDMEEIIGSVPSNIYGSFCRNCSEYGSTRLNMAKGIQKSDGSDQARLFSRQAMARYGIESGWTIFHVLSLKMNCLACEPRFKREFVGCTKRHLDPNFKFSVGAQAKKEDRDLVESRNHYWNQLSRYFAWDQSAKLADIDVGGLILHTIKGLLSAS